MGCRRCCGCGACDPSMLPVALPGLANLWLILVKDTP
jgi:ABC-type arginine transport system permease subunit